MEVRLIWADTRILTYGEEKIDTRYGTSPRDFLHYSTEDIRREFLISSMYIPDEVTAFYSHIDRMTVLGCMPVTQRVAIDKSLDTRKSFGCSYFLERREIGVFNLGGEGIITAGDQDYTLGRKDCLYITRGTKHVYFQSICNENPARFYMVSAPAHTSYETRLITIAQAAKRNVGTLESANKRTINQFIHPVVLQTCQISMGLTELETGSVWNTMPVHTHERRMEIYTYFDILEGGVVFHLMGQGSETRHIVIQNYEAVISPSWSIHSGVGTGSYSFIWAMGGENQEFDDMDTIDTTSLR
jgi:4-deoxy-L-threo-5-hexosulose-uronate ketol-isomerase